MVDTYLAIIICCKYKEKKQYIEEKARIYMILRGFCPVELNKLSFSVFLLMYLIICFSCFYP